MSKHKTFIYQTNDTKIIIKLKHAQEEIETYWEHIQTKLKVFSHSQELCIEEKKTYTSASPSVLSVLYSPKGNVLLIHPTRRPMI